MTTLADQVKQMETDAVAFRAALLAICHADAHAREIFPDYAAPGYGDLRAAINDARRALMRSASFDTGTADHV